MQLALFVIAFLLFVGLVIIHELGHLVVARRNGVKANEFGLGLPPRIKGKRLKSGMILSLNWLPLGGFVKLKGEYDADDRPGSFGAAGTWAKTKILLAGVSMNLLAGLILLTILAVVGLPKIFTTETVGQDQYTVKSDTKVISQAVYAGYIVPGSPAQKIGLGSQDKILSVSNGAQTKTVDSEQSLHDATASFAGQKVTITYKHGNTLETKNVQLLSQGQVNASLKTSNPKGYLGLEPYGLQVRRSTWSAPIVALGFTKQLIILTCKGLWHALQGLGSTIAGIVTLNHTARENGQAAASNQVGGPVAIIEVLWNSGNLGINFMLLVIAVISLTLALMNILPMPALDGGRLFVILVSHSFRKRLSRHAEELIHGTGMIVLLSLIVLITIVDVHRFF